MVRKGRGIKVYGKRRKGGIKVYGKRRKGGLRYMIREGSGRD